MGEGLRNVLAASRATSQLFCLVQESGKGPPGHTCGLLAFPEAVGLAGLAGACWAVARAECKAVLAGRRGGLAA